MRPDPVYTSYRRGPQAAGKLYCLLLILFMSSCKRGEPPRIYSAPPDLANEPAEVSLRWADMTLYTIRFSAFNSPTYSSRSLGYMGLAMYESIVQGDSSHHSMNGQLTGLTLPLKDEGKTYHWLLSLNAAQDTLLKLLYPVPANSHGFVHERIDSLANAMYVRYAKDIDPEIVNRSVLFGQKIALTIYDWSLTDGGDKGYTRNFDHNFVFPSGASYWVPPVGGQTDSPFPLHPRWGENRTFVKADKNIPIPAILPFSTDPKSEYYRIYKNVYEQDKKLTLEEREIAAWWADDPSETFSPPGHSYYIAKVAVKDSNTGIVTAGEAFARVGMAVADAFIHCWKIKYVYFNERPSSFVKQHIDTTWTQYWPEPPFPAFPSGHSIHAAAAATVLTDLFGGSFAFTDHSHEGRRKKDGARFLDLKYAARSYTSFWDAANESAYSRFLGGIHTQQDNDIAQQEGKKVGENVNALQWTK